MSVDALDLFSHTVPEATSRFLDAVRDAGLEPEVIEHPRPGPDGEALHSVVVRLGADDPHTVVLCVSGTHGIEGYGGSALQVGGLREGLFDPPAGTAVVLVHLVNPWGTAWSARENEDNVELFRHHYYQHHPKPPNPVFAVFYDVMGYGTAATLDEFLANRRRGRELTERVPYPDLMAALVSGQDTHPDAITYVGTEPTWSKRLLDDVLVRHATGARRLVVLDLHTASGPPGEAVVIHKADPDQTTQRAMVSGWFDDDLWDDQEPLAVWSWVEAVVPSATESIGVVIELGTEQLGPADQYIFPLDVWLRLHGDPSEPAARPHLERYRRFFYPEHDDWYRSVWPAGRRRIAQLMAGVAAWPVESGDHPA